MYAFAFMYVLFNTVRVAVTARMGWTLLHPGTFTSGSIAPSLLGGRACPQANASLPSSQTFLHQFKLPRRFFPPRMTFVRFYTKEIHHGSMVA